MPHNSSLESTLCLETSSNVLDLRTRCSCMCHTKQRTYSFASFKGSSYGLCVDADVYEKTETEMALQTSSSNAWKIVNKQARHSKDIVDSLTAPESAGISLRRPPVSLELPAFLLSAFLSSFSAPGATEEGGSDRRVASVGPRLEGRSWAGSARTGGRGPRPLEPRPLGTAGEPSLPAGFGFGQPRLRLAAAGQPLSHCSFSSSSSS